MTTILSSQTAWQTSIFKAEFFSEPQEIHACSLVLSRVLEGPGSTTDLEARLLKRLSITTDISGT